MTAKSSSESAPLSGEPLEREVERLYSLLGATTRRRILIKGYEVDVHAAFRKGPVHFSLIVECKGHNPKKVVSDLEMRSFLAKVLAAREAGLADKGVFVTTSTYAKTAISTADQHGIQCLRLSDLYNQLVDFQPYLEEVIAQFEATHLSRWYVEQTVSDVEDYDALTAESGATAIHRGTLAYVDDIFQNEREPRLALLGNFGTGKTSFCLKYRALLARRALANPSARIPILIDLRDFRSGLDIYQVATNALQRLPGVEIDLRLCLELGKMGRFLFLLDGLDEMATRIDRSIVNESLRELDRLRTEGDNYYLVTCRTHFFQEKISDEFLIDYRVLYLVEWGAPELREYLSKRYPDSWRAKLNQILRNQQLSDLAKTPLLLEILLSSNITLDGKVNTYNLLTGYTDEWVTKQSRRRGAVMTHDQRRRFAESLAMRLYTSDRNSLHYTELYEVAREFSGFRDASRVDHFDADARTCTFVTRDSQGNYAFRHKAFFEYFACSAIARSVEAGDRASLGLRELSSELVDFIMSRTLAKEGLENLQAWSRDNASAILSRNAVRLLVSMRQPLAIEVEERYKTSLTEWKEFERLAASESSLDIEEFWDRFGNLFDSAALGVSMRYFGPVGVVQVDDLRNDLRNETFLRIWQGIRGGRLKVIGPVNVDAYVRSMMSRVLVEIMRRHQMEIYSVSAVNVDILDDQPSPEEVAVSSERLGFVRTAMGTVMSNFPEEYRKILRLSWEDELTDTEIATSLNVPRSTIRDVRRRAISRLHEQLLSSAHFQE